MRKIITYFIILSFLPLFSRPLDLKDIEKSIPDSVKNSKFFFNEYLIENRAHRAGDLWMNTTNFGSFMKMRPHLNGLDTKFFIDECTGKESSGAEMPGGSGMEYLWAASLWCGGYIEDQKEDVNGYECTSFTGPFVSTAYEGWTNIYEGWETIYSHEMMPSDFDEDPEGRVLGRLYESSNVEGKYNCLFEGVYDPSSKAYEQFTTMYSDKCYKQAAFDNFDLVWHTPLGIEVRQTSFAWPYDFARNFIIADYTIYNRNSEKKDIYDFFIGIYVDDDIKNKNISQTGWDDDVCGFINKWDGYIDPATGEKKTVDMNMVWCADNDGREYELINSITGDIIETGSSEPLNGATGVFTIRVLRNPNPNLRYSFNIYNRNHRDESLDWGPKWKTGFHTDWKYDLTLYQKGYDDSNYDNLSNTWGVPIFGGRTEGMPMGDKGRYMVMSNDEFDYNLTGIREVYLDMDTQTDGTPIPQADKWQKWIITGTENEDEIPDGTIQKLNNIANGINERFILSFGPLGYESFINLATDPDSNGVIDSYIPNKKVWKFAYGDSLKLTLAYMVSENFHTRLEQDPNYYLDSNSVNLSDGLDVSLYDQGWYDAFYNVVWAERVYDTPMFDTPVKRWGETKKDGWYGEDVGADALFGDLAGDTFCWWLDASYAGPGAGEGDYELTIFTSPVTDHYGNPASNEDDLLRYGRQHVEGDYGITGNLSDGDGYGYMVKYDKETGTVPQGTWIRYGFDNGRLDAGDGVPDFSSPPPPPPPKIKVTELDHDIIVEWTSHEFYEKDDGTIGVAGPEFTFDPYTRLHDFEGYHIELSPDRQLKNFTTIFSIDKMNFSYQNVAIPSDYYSNPIPADSIYLFPDNYPLLITVGTKKYKLIPFGDNRDLTMDHSVGNEMTFTCTTESSPYPEWDKIRNYKFVLHDQTLAQHKFIAVTASDYGAPKMGVPAIKSSPESNATATVTSTLTTTKDVVVVPNPYRGDVDYAEMGWEILDGKYTYDEEYRKLVFLNIPERSVIRIYTLAGDLVKVITHNGNSEWNVPYWYGTNGAYWNLISDNNQAVVSGIYLFSVQDADKKKDDFVGKFVIIK